MNFSLLYTTGSVLGCYSCGLPILKILLAYVLQTGLVAAKGGPRVLVVTTVGVTGWGHRKHPAVVVAAGMWASCIATDEYLKFFNWCFDYLINDLYASLYVNFHLNEAKLCCRHSKMAASQGCLDGLL